MDLSLDALLQEAAEKLYNFQFQAGRQHQLSRNGAGDRAHADGLADYELTCNLPSQVRAALRRADGANPPRIVPPRRVRPRIDRLFWSRLVLPFLVLSVLVLLSSCCPSSSCPS